MHGQEAQHPALSSNQLFSGTKYRPEGEKFVGLAPSMLAPPKKVKIFVNAAFRHSNPALCYCNGHGGTITVLKYKMLTVTLKLVLSLFSRTLGDYDIAE